MARNTNQEPIFRASNSKLRTIISFLLIVTIVIATIVFWLIRKNVTQEKGLSYASTVSSPNISSIPGVNNETTREYIKLQKEENFNNAKEALSDNGSAIPTATDISYLGSSSIEATDDLAGKTAGCSIDELKKAREAGVSVVELKCRGCDARALLAAGYTVGDLKAAGFSAKQLIDAGIPISDLKAAGFTVQDLKDAGVDAATLLKNGFTPEDLINSGADFSDAELIAAGISKDVIKNLRQKKTKLYERSHHSSKK